MMAFIDFALRGADFSFHAEDAALFRTQIGTALFQSDPETFSGLIPTHRELRQNMPHSTILNLDEFTELGLRRNPIHRPDTVDIDSTNEDDDIAIAIDESSNEDEPDKPTADDDSHALSTDRTYSKSSKRKSTRAGTLPDTIRFIEIPKKNWTFGRSVFRQEKLHRDWDIKSSILFSTSDCLKIEYGSNSRTFAGAGVRNIRYDCLSCKRAISRGQTMLGVQELEEFARNFIYLNLETNILYEYPPYNTHTPGCQHSCTVPPPPTIDFFFNLSTADTNLLNLLTVTSCLAPLVCVSFDKFR